MDLNSSDWIAIYAAALSTLLAYLKLWELWRNNFRIDTSYNLTSSEIQGNEIYIRNLNNRPIMLEHWVLEWHKGRWPFKKKSVLIEAEDISEGIKIEPHDSMTLRFINEYHFQTGQPKSEGKNLYIRLHFVGKNQPKIVKVY